MPIETKRLLVLLLCGFVLLSLHLGMVQAVYQKPLQTDPRNPWLSIPEPAVSRGGILARGGEVISAGPGPMARVYPVPSLCHTVGYTDPSFGASGLEAALDEALAGRDARATIESWWDQIKGRHPQGADVITTLDLRLQTAAVNALGGRTGAVVVMDAQSGDLLALASAPVFRDPPTRESWQRDLARGNSPFLNRALQGMYPPGSALKIVTAAAALERGEGGFTLDCQGRTVIDGRQLKDAAAGGHGRVGLERALTVSCNVYFSNLGVKLGAGALTSQARRFGLGAAPPLVLPVAAGAFPRPRTRVELAEAAFGQGRTLVSPLQMALVAAAVANDGVIMRPRLVQALRYQWGREELPPQVWRRAISPATARILRADLAAAVSGGTGWRADAPGFIVGGKTGTAQAPGGKPHAWFIGYGFRGQRRLVVAVVVEHAGGGGAVAAPIAASIWRAAAGGAVD